MNASQVKYALARIDSIVARKLGLLVDALNDKEPQPITPGQRYDLVRLRKVSLRTDINSIQTYTDVEDAFDFSKHTRKDVRQSKEFNDKRRAMEAYVLRIKDEIVLGDEENAKQLIISFEAD